MLTTKAIFERKIPGFDLRECSISAIETLPHNEYTEFSGNLLQDYDFIADRKDILGMGDDGSIRTLLVMDGGSSDGILVDSSGYNYPRYAAFMPNIKPYINSQILQLADGIIKGGTQNTPNGRCVISFDEMGERFGVTVSPDNGIGQMLISALNMSDEVAELEMTENGFDVTYYLDYCENLDQEHLPAASPTTKLSDILRCNFEDVHLCHRDIDDDTATISELSDTTLTDEGRQVWADVLGAEVHRVYTGMYGLQIELSGVKAARIYDFGAALAGYCLQENYEKWFAPEDTEPKQTMKME